MFIVRRILFVWWIFKLDDTSWAQLMLLNYLNLIILIYVGGVRPFNNKYDNRLESFNELCVCWIS